MNAEVLIRSSREKKRRRMKSYLRQFWPLYVFVLPAVLDVFVFKYVPIEGIQIAFRSYKSKLGSFGSPWIGLEYFVKFLSSPNFWQLISNTFLLSFYSLIFGFPIPILLSLVINELQNQKYKRVVQTVTYAPHFISTVAIVGLINLFLDLDTGLLNLFRDMIGFEKVNFRTMPEAFRPAYIISGIWQQTGWNSIIYLAALSAIDVEMLEAAKIDGASRLQKIWYIDIPSIMPTMVIMLILRCGSLLSVGYEKVLLMQNDLIRDVSEVISTYNYRMGILQGQFSYTTAIGLFNSVVNCSILVLVNVISRKVNETSLW